MATCANCGAPFDVGTRFCVRCGHPRGPEQFAPARPGVPVPPGFVRVGPTILPVWLVAVVTVLAFAGGAGATYLLTSSPGQQSAASSVVPSPEPPPPTDPGPTDPGPTDPGPTDPGPTDPATTDTPSSGDPAAVVQQYYDDLNAGDYQAAWQLGADNFAGTSYSRWQSGFAGTAHVDLQVTDDPADPTLADVVITSTQTDGSTQQYTGTYTVQGGLIVAADVH
ncbi:cytoskeletal protein RodZ [Streptacidiphilus sp. MAP12-33]|uniref:hypothetical protein n=1 Tax=Streptacidiphilus sp. MAP12-33 TaxID=3156266 RepID=UPI003511965D